MRISAFLLSILLSVLWLSDVINAAACNQFDVNYDCEAYSGGACRWVNSKCVCASDVKLDILFAVDTSGSIGWSGFQVDKAFLKTLVTQGINNGSRIGFTMFATYVNLSRPIQAWATTDLENYVDGIWWSAGWTNTPSLLSSALTQFASTYDPERQQVLIMITDGNPCLPESLGGCPQSVCQYAARLRSAGIRVIIIGVGDGLNTLYVECLCQTTDDFIPVASFNDAAFNSIMGSLSGIICPVSIECKLTEIKAEHKQSSWDFRLNRFIEIYNSGVDFDADAITLSGMVTGTGPSGVTIPQGSYVVFYDASDVTSNPATAMVTCHLCGDVCDLSNCPSKTASNAYCWCGNSIYIACSNTADGACTSGSLPSTSYANAENGCGTCSFGSSTRTGWTQSIYDASSGDLIDAVTWDATTWITTDDGFAYELIAKGFDNDVGDNWAQSCSPFGTPGSDPRAQCSTSCTLGGCGGNNNCNLGTGLCECNTTTGYYPQCTTDGNYTSCTKCLLVPQAGNCSVLWVSNGTETYAYYYWSGVSRSGETIYKLTYYEGGGDPGNMATTSVYDTSNKQYDTFRSITSAYQTGNGITNGYVQTVILVCDDNNVCTEYDSLPTICYVITESPTHEPTKAPTPDPTPQPTDPPTMAPTQPCPHVYWSNTDVCKIDRCFKCIDNDTLACCLDNYDDRKYDGDRVDRDNFDCALDVQMDKPTKRNWGDSDHGLSKVGDYPTAGYLLKATTHVFNLRIWPENYPCPVNISWELVWVSTDCNYGNSRRRLAQDGTTIVCDPNSVSMIRAGLYLNETMGRVIAKNGTDYANLRVELDVQQIDCDEAAALLGLNTTRRRRLASGDTSCFDNVAIYGELIITNFSNGCRDDCNDGRAYPMNIPVYYNYQDAKLLIYGNEKPLPAWLWWLIAALACFLIILAFLVYKYWWKNKATGAALNAAQKDLDAAVAEQEDGFGADLDANQVMFNPIATGYDPNAPAGAVGPNAPPVNDGGQAQFANVQIQREVFRQEYGQKMGDTR